MVELLNFEGLGCFITRNPVADQGKAAAAAMLLAPRVGQCC
jgi:hypothetical protein